MKKIIKSSALLFGVCFIAAQATAQLASDAPALTQAKATEIQKRTVSPAKANTVTVQTASSTSSSPVVLKSAAKKEPVQTEQTSSLPAVVPAKLPEVSSQGGAAPKSGGN